jgi:mRNA interferase RelE/StbE
MKIFYQKKFLKDLSKLPSPQRKKIEDFVFVELPSISSFNQLHHTERMIGYPHYYKIRFGDYRLGFHFAEDKLTLERVLHRKEVYRYFP